MNTIRFIAILAMVGMVACGGGSGSGTNSPPGASTWEQVNVPINSGLYMHSNALALCAIPNSRVWHRPGVDPLIDCVRLRAVV